MKTEIQIGDVELSFDEAAETLAAIRAGMVDAVVVEGATGHEVFTFRDPSHPFRMLVEAMSQGAALANRDGLIGYCNPCFRRLVAVADPIGYTLAELAAPADRAIVEQLLVDAHAGAGHREARLLGPEGLPVPVLLSVSPGELADTEILCVVATDLSEHHRQEALYAAARAGIEARDRLFAVAAHELRGGLAAINMNAFALDQIIHEPPPKVREMLATLRRQSNLLSSLVGKLLGVGTLGAGQLPLSFDEVDLAEEVRAIVERDDDALRKSGSELTLELAPARGRWDRVRVQQVIENLLSNAIKYGRGAPIRIFVERDKHTARLGVEDRGAGIPAGDRERVLRPYARMESVRQQPGLGLGLYITAEIVKAHRGTIRIEEREGGGARFVVELPFT
jgi:signal transduction histidine kinase